jgi:hypothetical protein
LALVGNPRSVEFVAQACLIDRFQQARAKAAVHAHRKANNLAAGIRAK